jgi:type IV secretory pathway TrbF-like protein
MKLTKNNQGFIGLLGMVLTLAIILVIVYISFKTYFKPNLTGISNPSETGINTTSYQSILESSKKKVEDINKQTLERQKQLEGLK